MERARWVMAPSFRIGLVLLLLGPPGCGGPQAQVGEPADPGAVEVVMAHWAALQRRDWKSAYDGLHPELKADKLPLKRFADFHARRRGSQGFPRDIKVATAERTGEDVAVSFDVITVPPGGGEPVA